LADGIVDTFGGSPVGARVAESQSVGILAKVRALMKTEFMCDRKRKRCPGGDLQRAEEVDQR
jgi:hypothetical protein